MGAADKATYEQNAENEAAEEAAFEAAFSGTDQAPESDAAATTDQPGAESEQQVEAAPAVQEPTAAVAEPVKEPTVAEVLEQLAAERTERQKLNDKVFGKVGELQQKIDAMKTTAHGISPKARERLAADFPELAEMLFESSAPAQAEQQSAPVAAQVPVHTDLGADGFTSEQRMELRLLKRDHPDYVQVAGSPEFTAWQTTALSAADAAALVDAWDADLVSKRITEFKTWRAAQTAASNKAAADKLAKQNRLLGAITPQGVPRASSSSSGSDDEETAMMEAYGKNKR